MSSMAGNTSMDLTLIVIKLFLLKWFNFYNINFPSLYLDFSLSNNTGAAPADGSNCESSFLRKNCSQLFYTENGLESYRCFRGEQWHLPQRNEEQQVRRNGILWHCLFNKNLN